MKRIVRKSVLNIKPYVPGRPIDEVKRELGLKDVIKLASNESPFPPSPKVIKAISLQIRNINRYPDGECYYLRRELAKQLKVSPQQIVFGNGSDEIIVLVLRAYIDNGDEVVIAKPSFLIYEIASKIAGAKVRAVPLKVLNYDLDGMRRAVTKKTKVIFIGNPDNPAGTYVTRKQLSAFLKKIRKDIIVFIDEAYFEYVSSKDYPNGINLLKRYKNLIVTRTFSKTYGLAGLRVGYGVTSKETADFLNRIREPFNVDSLAQAAALACLKDKGYYKGLMKKINEQKKYIYKSVKDLGLSCNKSVTNFILIDVKQDATKVVKKLLKKGIIVRNMGFWGMKNFIRVSIGTKEENKKIINALRKIL